MEFNFDQWVKDAQADPEEFDRKRREEIEKIISSAPESRQAHLRYLQFCIDVERWKSSTPLAACTRISAMMWRRVGDLQSALYDFQTVVGKTLEVLPRPDGTAARRPD